MRIRMSFCGMLRMSPGMFSTFPETHPEVVSMNRISSGWRFVALVCILTFVLGAHSCAHHGSHGHHGDQNGSHDHHCPAQ
jgi:hypothetical protein